MHIHVIHVGYKLSGGRMHHEKKAAAKPGGPTWTDAHEEALVAAVAEARRGFVCFRIVA